MQLRYVSHYWHTVRPEDLSPFRVQITPRWSLYLVYGFTRSTEKSPFLVRSANIPGAIYKINLYGVPGQQSISIKRECVERIRSFVVFFVKYSDHLNYR